MAHTNETVNYRLSQFVGTDIPNPLVDYNGDMEKIDTAIKNVADSAVSEGGRITALETQNGSEVLTTTAQTLSGAVNELDGEVGAIDTRLTTAEGKITSDEGTLATAVGNISTLSGKVSALETKVGSAVLTTTASDCSGAINELDAEDGVLAGKITALETQNGSEVLLTISQTLSGAINELYNAPASSVDADDVSYDNTNSGLTATNVQSAIDELAQGGAGTVEADDVSYDNTQSGLTASNVQNAIDEVAVLGSAVLLGTTTSQTDVSIDASADDYKFIAVLSSTSDTQNVVVASTIVPASLFKTITQLQARWYASNAEHYSMATYVDATHINIRTTANSYCQVYGIK